MAFLLTGSGGCVRYEEEEQRISRLDNVLIESHMGFLGLCEYIVFLFGSDLRPLRKAEQI